MKRIFGFLLKTAPFAILFPLLTLSITAHGLEVSQEGTPLKKENVPEPLKPWVEWVLHDHQEELCPYFQDGTEDKRCAWASKLELSIEETSGRFSQEWHLYAKGSVPLPGDSDHWPVEVKVNGQPAKVLPQEDRPFLYLEPGQYTITGSFSWDELPESFQIPDDTAILQLTVKGETKPFPKVEESGLVWLQKEVVAEKEENRLEMRVHRKLNDDIPFQLTTLLTLNVSGQNREEVFERVLTDGWIPMELKSPIPARLEKGGQLRVQVKPGEWRVEITARYRSPVNKLQFMERPAPWSKEEVWVFEAHNDLRLVWIEGVPSIDPQQTTLPDAWKRFPAYRLKKGDTLKMVEKRRGDSDPAPDQLQLRREWWLDFDGEGFTIRDDITGTLNRSWRLEMNPPVTLGRISVDGKDQFITKLPGEKKLGIEIRQGSVDVSADSRIDKRECKAPAVGWDHNFQKVSGVLNIPPGWRLFNVTGADRVRDTWIDDWTLLDIFLVLILALIFLKLWGVKWGIVALVTFVLTFPEKGAPQWIWLAVVAGYAVLRLLPKGKIFSLMKVYKFITLLLLVIFSIPFMVTQVREGIYPALKDRYRVMEARSFVPSRTLSKKPMRPVPGEVMLDMAEDKAGFGGTLEGRMIAKEKLAAPPEPMPQVQQKIVRKGYDYQRQLNLQEQRPGTKVQTGPGLPGWNWRSVSLQWNGPVEKTQQIGFMLIPPYVNLILAFVRVILLALLILCVLEISRESWKKLLKPKMAVFLLPFLIGTMLVTPAIASSNFPPKEMLDELRQRLLEDPACYPECASISRMQMEVSSNTLQARLEVNAESAVAIPLPGSAKEWSPNQVAIDGKPFAGLLKGEDGQLWIELTPGVHQITLSGPLPEKDSVQVPLPLKPYRLDANVNGWTLEGLHEDGIPDDTLRLTRSQAIRAAGTTSASAVTDGGLVPFVLVKRELVLGLNWELDTRIVRMTPTGVPVVLEVPLLEGESVISSDVRVKDRKVMVNMAPNASEVTWRSVLEEKPAIQLKAPLAISYMEVWELDVSPVWHVSFEGIPVVHSAQPAGKWLPEWRPWPGEKVTINVLRPEGVPGQTLTIDKSVVDVTPGLRFTEMVLSLKLRSSLGGQHVLTLPKGADLQSVEIDQKVQPIRLEAGKITLPIVPGEQEVKIKWQQSSGIKTFFKAPKIDLGIKSVNSETKFHMPRNRWILFAWGPTMGPAVMFWSLLIVILLFSIGLSRIGWTPLRTWHWFLLGIGITQFPEIPVIATVFVAGWLLVIGWRQNRPEVGKFWFDLRQIVLVIYTLFAIIALFVAIHQGLLGLPDMQIAGNGSTSRMLRWFQDRSSEVLGRPWSLSIPLYYYRIAMLAWALWIAFSLLKWLKWGWGAFTEGGAWRSLGVFKKKAPTNSQG